jgi:hypothetical protein
MSDAYWKIWNPEVQARIDRDIERHRKADGSFVVDGVAAGAEVQVEQLTHDFFFGANIFNFNQLGTPDLQPQVQGTVRHAFQLGHHSVLLENVRDGTGPPAIPRRRAGQRGVLERGG